MDFVFKQRYYLVILMSVETGSRKIWENQLDHLLVEFPPHVLSRIIVDYLLYHPLEFDTTRVYLDSTGTELCQFADLGLALTRTTIDVKTTTGPWINVISTKPLSDLVKSWSIILSNNNSISYGSMYLGCCQIGKKPEHFTQIGLYGGQSRAVLCTIHVGHMILSFGVFDKIGKMDIELKINSMADHFFVSVGYFGQFVSIGQ
jgi:hypothetical protein